MKYYGTKNNRDYGFYEENFGGAIEITDEYWTELLNKQTKGDKIILYENNVIAVDKKEYEFENGKWKKLAPKEIEARQLNIENELRKQEIRDELDEIDKKRIRALAEPALKDDETTWLEYYNTQMVLLRKEFSELS